MVDQLSSRLGRSATLLYNGFFLAGIAELAGEPVWAHAGAVYVESLAYLAKLGSGDLTLGDSVQFLQWLSSASAMHPERVMVGHGGAACNNTSQFVFDLAAYLLVCHCSGGWYYLNNQGYNIDQGLLCPHKEYALSLGEPVGVMSRVSR